MTITLPVFKSQLTQQFQANNFVPIQSAKLTVSNAGATGSASVTFTAKPGTQRVTMKITNSGTKGCYLATGHTTATAVASSSTPTPTAGTPIIATCDYIAAGAILTQDYVQGTDTLAAICAGSDTSVLEVSIGYGQ